MLLFLLCIACVFCFVMHRLLVFDYVDNEAAATTAATPLLHYYYSDNNNKRRRHHHNNNNNSKSLFTIIQFADLHFGGDRSKDEHTKQVMRNVLRAEEEGGASVDLVVFSGDQISGWLIDEPSIKARKRMHLLDDALGVVRSAGIPYAVLWGNHDDQPYHFDTGVWFTWTLRTSFLIAIVIFLVLLYIFSYGQKNKNGNAFLFLGILMVLLMTAFYMVVLTKPSKNARNIMQAHDEFKKKGHNLNIGSSWITHGVGGNFYYHVPILNHSLLLIFLDSGGGRIPERIYDEQVVWAESIQDAFPQAISLVFLHIPLPEYTTISGGGEKLRCFGGDGSGRGGETPSSVNYEHKSLYEGLGRKGKTKAIFVGHDHANSWCCLPPLIIGRKKTIMPALCYGKHTGYGGYDDDTPAIRGARVIRVNVSSLSLLHITTWLRMEDATLQGSGVLF